MRNPEAIAVERFKEIRQARDTIAKTDAALAKSRERQEELRRQLGSADIRDREKLAAALIDSKPEPASEAEKVPAELKREEQRTEAPRRRRRACPPRDSEGRRGEPGRLDSKRREGDGQGSPALRGRDRRARGRSREHGRASNVARLAGRRDDEQCREIFWAVVLILPDDRGSASLERSSYFGRMPRT
jgi:hypothetical protein